MNTQKQIVGTCTHCKKPAQWNSPGLDPQGNLWCNGCIDKERSNIFFRSVKQFTDGGEYIFDGGVVLNGVVVWKDKSTWVEGGSRSVKLTEDEKSLTPTEIANVINTEYNIVGYIRCSDCGTKMTKDQVAGYPLFAGVSCASCWGKHQQKLEQQRKSGHVCGMCREPYDNCCC